MFEHFYSRNIHFDTLNVLKSWINKPNLSFLEIGSAEGSSAIGIIETVLTDTSSKVTCVDTWDPVPMNGFFPDDFETNFNNNTQQYANQIIKVKSNSVTWLTANQDKRFDFIYIDGDHSYEGCKSDIELSWNLLKPGCWMAIDDYNFDGVGAAVNEFVNSHNNNLVKLVTEIQVWLQKI